MMHRLHILLPAALLSFGAVPTLADVWQKFLERYPDLAGDYTKSHIGFEPLPDACKGDNPDEEQCRIHLDDKKEAVNGELFFYDDSCDDYKIMRLRTAAWDAVRLAKISAYDPGFHSGDPKDQEIWEMYFGPNFHDNLDDGTGWTGVQRVTRNLERAWEFKKESKYYVYTTCRDVKDLCHPRDGNGKILEVGGYAWTDHPEWQGQKMTREHIALCDIFWGLDDMGTKMNQVFDENQKGDHKWADLAVYQKNMGQAFLHEMMHLESVGQPPIVDMLIGDGRKWAYGPKMVYKLAHRQHRGELAGGIKESSINADSYAWMANSLHFYHTIDRVPRPENYKPPSLSKRLPFADRRLEARQQSEEERLELHAVQLHLGRYEGTATDEQLAAAAEEQINAFLSNSDDKEDGGGGGAKFSERCKDQSISAEGLLEATCQDSNGHEKRSKEDLNLCVQYDGNGGMGPQDNGQYAKSCSQCFFNKPLSESWPLTPEDMAILNCVCAGLGPRLSMNDVIKVQDDGLMECFGHISVPV